MGTDMIEFYFKVVFTIAIIVLVGFGILVGKLI